MTDKLRAAAQAALDAMKLAGDHGTVMLAYPAIESWLYHRVDQRLDDAIKAVEDALAEPAIKESLTVAEPVAWMWDQADYRDTDLRGRGWHPVMGRQNPNNESMTRNVKALYIAPPRREWIGLTDEEVMILNRKSYDVQIGLLPLTFYRAIEAKLREKNT